MSIEPRAPEFLRGAQDPRYAEGLDHYLAGRWYECHDVLEDLWVECTGPEKLHYHALIQVAVCLLHMQRGNWRGALKLGQQADEKLARLPAVFLGLDLASLRTGLRALLTPVALAPEAQRGQFRPEAHTIPALRFVAPSHT